MADVSVGLRFKRVWREIIEFDDAAFPGWRQSPLTYWGCALAGEVGEVCNALKKLEGGGTHRNPPTTAELLEEFADVQAYIALTLARLGVSLDEFTTAIEVKHAEVRRRMAGVTSGAFRP